MLFIAGYSSVVRNKDLHYRLQRKRRHVIVTAKIVTILLLFSKYNCLLVVYYYSVTIFSTNL